MDEAIGNKISRELEDKKNELRSLMKNNKEELKNQIQASKVRLPLLNEELKTQVRSLKEENSELEHEIELLGRIVITICVWFRKRRDWRPS
ncbi:hypothetical protein JTB14_005496 [Gonioctena quinquepunctata]|nr:hypothetical protein JTB14_005496 [Gonioctena quinquepunctata]